MWLHYNMNILVSVIIVIAASGITPSYGKGIEGRFATPKCDHNDLIQAGSEMFRCQTEAFHQYVENTLKNYEDETNDAMTFDLQQLCKSYNLYALEKMKICHTNFADKCLPDYVSKFVDEIYEASKLKFCNSPTTPFVNGSLEDVEKIQAAFGELLQSCENDPDCPQGFLTSDKQCTLDEMIFFEGRFSQCLKDPLEKLLVAIGTYFNEDGNLDDISVCKTIGKLLDQCFLENYCYSKREMEVFGAIVVHVYNLGMESLVMVEQEFGSLTDYVESHNDLTLKWNETTIGKLPDLINTADPITKKALDFADHIVDDYTREDCPLNRNQFNLK